MIIIYNILFMLGFILAGPYFIYKLIVSDKWREGLPMRLGLYPKAIHQALSHKKTIWIHASSVGEVKVALTLLKKIQEIWPTHHVVLTTVTRTGNHVARHTVDSSVTVLYFPLDFIFAVGRAIRVIHPELVILVEAELWPNFLAQIYRRKIPVALVNIRISMHSFRRYRWGKFFVRQFLKHLSLLTAPTAREANKMKILGANPLNIHVVGNLKYEKDDFREPDIQEKKGIMKNLGIPESGRVLLAGSTHPGEDEVLIDIYLDLLKCFPDLYLILAPRHPERARRVLEAVSQRGLEGCLKTELVSQNSYRVIVLDTIGELERIYSIADVVFIGKSLTRKGGQNFLEPARYGKAIVFGPHMENFEDMVAQFIEQDAVIQVQNSSSLKEIIKKLLNSPEGRENFGRRARQILVSNQGSVDRNMRLLEKLLKGKEFSDL